MTNIRYGVAKLKQVHVHSIVVDVSRENIKYTQWLLTSAGKTILLRGERGAKSFP